MNSHFKDHINLLNSHHSVLGNCYLFSVEKMTFGLFDLIAPKLGVKSENRRDFLLDSTPQNKKFHRLDLFF